MEPDEAEPARESEVFPLCALALAACFAQVLDISAQPRPFCHGRDAHVDPPPRASVRAGCRGLRFVGTAWLPKPLNP